MGISRRGFIKGAGALGSMATGISMDLISFAAQAAQRDGTARRALPALDVKKIKSACAICPNFCGI